MCAQDRSWADGVRHVRLIDTIIVPQLPGAICCLLSHTLELLRAGIIFLPYISRWCIIVIICQD